MSKIKKIDQFLSESAIYESSLNRIKFWINSKDIAGITAFRNTLTNVTDNTLLDYEIGHKYSKSENKLRNRDLSAALKKLGYGVTKIAGSYVEGGLETQEESFIVVNLNDDVNFKDNLFKLAEYYNQDSFLYKKVDDENAVIIGTNTFDYPGYGNVINIGKFMEKVNSTYMSRIGSQGFAFIDNELNIEPHKPYTFHDRKEFRKKYYHKIKEILNIEEFSDADRMGKWACSNIGDKVIKNAIKPN